MRPPATRSLGLLALYLLVATTVLGQSSPFTSTEEERVLRQWQEERALAVPLVRAMLLAEGVSDPAELAAHEASVEEALAEIDRHVRDRHSAEKKAKTIFKRLHRDVLERYDENAQLTDLADGGRFNCVTGTTLFYLAAQRHGVPVALHVTPVHVYAVADPAGEALRIEITDPKKGFDFDDEREDVIEHLLAYKMITPEELEFEGEDAIYRAFVEDEWLVQSEALVGIVYYNEGAFHLEAEEYAEALMAYEKALLVEPEREEYEQAHAVALALLSYAHGDDPEYVAPLLHRALAVQHGDEAFAEVALPLVQGLAAQRAAERAFEPALETVRLAGEHLPPGDETQDALTSLEAGIYHDWAVSLSRRGDYEAAVQQSRRAYDLMPDEDRIREGYVATACQHALRRTEAGEGAAALEDIEALLSLAPEFPLVGDTYGRLVALTVLYGADPLYREDPEAAEELVLRALEVAPDMVALKSAMGAVYHEKAMAEIRSGNYDAAAAFVEEGLRYSPDNEFLQEDLDLIRAAR